MINHHHLHFDEHQVGETLSSLLKMLPTASPANSHLNDTLIEKLKEQLNKRICKNRILAASDDCLHNQLKAKNSIEFKWINFIVELISLQMFK